MRQFIVTLMLLCLVASVVNTAYPQASDDRVTVSNVKLTRKFNYDHVSGRQKPYMEVTADIGNPTNSDYSYVLLRVVQYNNDGRVISQGYPDFDLSIPANTTHKFTAKCEQYTVRVVIQILKVKR